MQNEPNRSYILKICTGESIRTLVFTDTFQPALAERAHHVAIAHAQAKQGTKVNHTSHLPNPGAESFVQRQLTRAGADVEAR